MTDSRIFWLFLAIALLFAMLFGSQIDHLSAQAQRHLIDGSCQGTAEISYIAQPNGLLVHIPWSEIGCGVEWNLLPTVTPAS